MIDRYPPVTNSIGFIESEIADVKSFCDRWLMSHGYKKGETLNAGFKEAVMQLFPETGWRLLLIQCQGGWTALLKDANNECEGAISLIAQELNCRGVIATQIPSDEKTDLSAIQLLTFDGPSAGRTISLVDEYGKWSFDSYGNLLPCESASNYQKRRKRDRFTPEILRECLDYFGIRSNDESFFTNHCILYQPPKQTYTGKELRVNDVVIKK